MASEPSRVTGPPPLEHLREAQRLRVVSGVTMLETLFVVALVSLVGSMSLALAGGWRDRTRSLGAARLVLAQVRLARAHAIREGVTVALVFSQVREGRYSFRPYQDGNDNGVRQADIDRGLDTPLGPPVRLSEWFPATDLRIAIPLLPIDDGGALPAGSSPVRLAGGTLILSCSPGGTMSSGTLYVSGPNDDEFAIRTLGTTGRLRFFEYSKSSSTWLERW